MPLRDHFRSPLDDVHSWDELHGAWPTVIVQHLIKVLPEPYFAVPSVHLGTICEVDIGTFRSKSGENAAESSPNGSPVATYAPPAPTLTIEPTLSTTDDYEVRIYSGRRNRRLVAAIEIVNPSNKDRPENRGKFASKVAALLQNGVCVSLVDVVSTLDFNLYGDALAAVDGFDPQLGDEPHPMYAVTLRTRMEGNRKLLDTWFYPLSVGSVLPTLPIWLNEASAVSLDLEPTYEETCRILRIR
ncbi:MAG TPA: DUF4058 family protein [Urbifossiella sp.]|nr:DUF4058 family protein [Urbifossiella sp.]